MLNTHRRIHPFLEVAMRRALMLFAVPAVLALAGFSHAPPAASSLTVSLSCNNDGGYTFACYASASGGSGNYTTYQWTWWQKRLSHTTSARTLTGTSPEFFESCRADYTVYVTLTVTDSQGATGTASTQITCRFLPD
jgi:hypothetical protein